MSDWISEVPKVDLLAIHYALCIAAKRPYVEDEELEKFHRLTNLCWNEHCRRLMTDRDRYLAEVGYGLVPARLLEDLA